MIALKFKQRKYDYDCMQQKNGLSWFKYRFEFLMMWQVTPILLGFYRR